MSDNHRRYCAINQALRRLSPHLKGHAERHLVTLTALICGIVGSKQSQLPAIASKTSGPAKRQSRITIFERWLKNDKVTVERFYLPYVTALLKSLPDAPLVLVMDGSQLGNRCMALVVSVLYQNRALPLCWLVVQGKKGHLPQDLHCQLFRQAQKLLGAEREVIFLGDGEFDGTDLLAALEQAGWRYVCRTAQNAYLYEEGIPFQGTDLHLRPGDLFEIEGVTFTQSQYAFVTYVAVWEVAYEAPLFLVSNMDIGEEALFYYRQRYGIETFFFDQKSRGFHLANSHLRDPKHLERLLIASCSGYIWMVCLGTIVKKRGLLPVIHRRSRCGLSLFQIGLLWLEHCLNEGQELWVDFILSLSRGRTFSVG